MDAYIFVDSFNQCCGHGDYRTGMEIATFTIDGREVNSPVFLSAARAKQWLKDRGCDYEYGPKLVTLKLIED